MDVTTAARGVLDLMGGEGVVLSDDLNEVEAKVREAVLRVGARAVELQLEGKKLGYEGSSRPCPCGGTQKFVGHRPRTLASLLGPLTFERAYYHCAACGAGSRPYDERAGLGEGHETVALAKAAVLLAAHDPFAPAARLLHALTGQRLGDRTVLRLAERVGAAAAAREASAASAALGEAKTWEAPAAEAAPARLYVAVDGVMVHRGDWNEAKCATCYWDTEPKPAERKPAPEGRGEREARYAVRFEAAADFAAFVWGLACRCGLEGAREVVLLGDGAAWIWDHVAPILGAGEGPKVTCVTDWYHVMEHVWACGKALHGEGSAATEAWAKGYETLLWEGKYPRVLELLAEERSRTRSPPRRAALEQLATYLANQGGRLDYARFRAAGFDIGSGRVEAACKHVVAVRMKRSGMIWSDDGAQQMLSLRTAYLNGWWDQLWDARPLVA